MYSRNSFGSYYPISSTIHKLNPVMKLINFVITILVLLLSNNLQINIFVLVLTIIMMLLSYVPFKYYFNTFWSLRYIYLFLIFFLYSLGINFNDTVCYLIKLIVIVEYLNILAFTTSPSQSVYGIERFLSMFNFLMLPVNKIAIKINSILRYFPLLLVVNYKSIKAQSSRGIDYYNSNIFGRIHVFMSLLSNSLRLTKAKSKEINYACELKLYNNKMYRTNYQTNRVGFNDLFFFIFHLALLYACVVEKGLL